MSSSMFCWRTFRGVWPALLAKENGCYYVQLLLIYPGRKRKTYSRNINKAQNQRTNSPITHVIHRNALISQEI